MLLTAPQERATKARARKKVKTTVRVENEMERAKATEEVLPQRITQMSRGEPTTPQRGVGVNGFYSTPGCSIMVLVKGWSI